MGNQNQNKLIVLCLLLLATCGGVFSISSSSSSIATKPYALEEYLAEVEGYNVQDISPLSQEVKQTLDLDDYISATYAGTDGNVSLYIGFYYTLDKVSAAHSPLICFPGQGWKIERPTIRTLNVDGLSVQYAEMTASILDNKELVLYWYQAFKLTTPEIYRNKINVFLNKFKGKKEDNAFVRVTVPYTGDDRERALQVGEDFIRAFYPKFISYMNANDMTAK